MSKAALPWGKAEFFPAISHDAGKLLFYVLFYILFYNLILLATQMFFLQDGSKELLIIFIFSLPQFYLKPFLICPEKGKI